MIITRRYRVRAQRLADGVGSHVVLEALVELAALTRDETQRPT